MTHPLALRGRPTSRQLLARILEEPDLATQIQALSPPALAAVIARIGLEDAGEIVAFATTEQVAQVFDEDLWTSDRPGEDERFDAERFIVWLEVMLEAGDAFVAERLSELSPDLVTLAFHRHVLVLDFEAQMAGLGLREAARAENALSNLLTEDIDQFLIVFRGSNGWDAILTTLLALDRDHHDLLVGILERCCAMTLEHIEDAGGLCEVLTSSEMLEEDVAAEREDRRAEAGHVVPSSAAAFLKLARDTSEATATERDPLTRAWFRGLSKTPAAAKADVPAAPALMALLQESEVVETATPPLLPAGAPASSEPLFLQAMRVLAEEDHGLFLQRSEEVAYLANVLAAGCSFQGRRMRPIEATRAAIAATNLGLEISFPARTKDPLATATRLLRERPADGLFRLAWGTLQRDIVLAAAELLATKLPPQAALRMRAAIAKGTPWRALADVDGPDTWRGLIDECPTLHGRFFTTASDLAMAHALLVEWGCEPHGP